MISSKLTAGFVALILVAATQIENSAAVAAEPVGYQIGAYTKTVQFVSGSINHFHFEILGSSKAKANFLRPKWSWRGRC